MIGPLSISRLPAVFFDGCYRVLGCLPSNLANFKRFSASFNMLPESQWLEIDMQHHNVPILDQSASSSCTGHASAAITEYSRAQVGLPFMQLSPWFVYSQINGGRDAGASISDALNTMMKLGIAPDRDVPHGTILKQQISQQAYDNAKHLCVTSAYHCSTFEEICTAITLGSPVSLGLYVGNNFAQLDNEGVAPLPGGGGGGHNVVGMGLKRSSKYGWVIKFQNSWGQKFGLNGFGYLQKNSLRYMNTDAFAVQMVSGDSDVPVATN